MRIKRLCAAGCGRKTWDAKAALCWVCENSPGSGLIFTGREE